MEDTAVEDAMAIANAYRGATEADTMELLNVQSKTGLSAEGSPVLSNSLPHDKVKYYLVSAQWLRKAWAYVLKPPKNIPKDWLDEVGRIDNSSLVESNLGHLSPPQRQSAGAPSNGRERLHGSHTKRKDLQHEQNFYLVGGHAWLLLSQKFGYTNTCSAIVRVHKTQESSLAVDILDSGVPSAGSSSNGHSVLIPIPASGRFPYERSLGSAAISEETMKNPQDDEDHVEVGGEGTEKRVVHAIPNHVAVNGRQQVSDDSDNDQDVSPRKQEGRYLDGLPTDDIGGVGGSQQQVLLLPPSTTASNVTSSSLYSPIGKVGASRGPSNADDFGFEPATMNGVTTNSGDIWAMDRDNIGSVPTFTTLTTLSRFRYGSGLGNLGNTCFMNSTLQCLGHTQPLQSYFLSGEFRRDLNRGNPLGTGGELASSFAALISDMWSEETTCRVAESSSLLDQGSSCARWSSSTGHVVYPRDFKYIVGKHAEQFMGYEQHDSQEFATYLLDALHEDTNRVTKKPYIEKPEQEDGESDQQAAAKAWGLHKQRENSRVLENFMGQVKSRVQCCEPGCGRVSTTFDPFMYLSVPIPGSSERTLTIHYVPLDPARRVQSLSITLPKTGTIQELAKRTRDQVLKLGIERNLSVDDLAAVDIWQKEVYSWYKFKDEIDRIRDNDETYLFAMRPSAEILAESEKSSEDRDDGLDTYNIRESQPKRYKLDLATITRLNAGDNWTTDLAKYLRNHLGFLNAFNPSKGTTDDRVKLFQRTTTFLEQCYNDTKELELSLNARQVNEDVLTELVDRCNASPVFENVRSMHDLAVLEFCAGKMRAEILKLIKAEKNDSPGGVKITIRMKAPGVVQAARSQYLCTPLVLRISANLTVYGLRQQLAKRLTRSIRRPDTRAAGQSTSESDATAAPHSADGREPEVAKRQIINGGFDNTFGSPELLAMRQIPLSYDRKNPGYMVKSYENSYQLGSLEKARGYRSMENDHHRVRMASPGDSEEHQIVAHLVGDQGTVNLEWTNDMIDRFFDTEEYETVEEASPEVTAEESAPGSFARKAGKNSTSVLDCIEKYCQMEQLEETEMWYCNLCEKHVRAWKQFYLYRTPPILIIHLKRFQYSATTHRRDKIGLFINFPLKGLDLTQHVTHWTEEEKPIYDCYAVSNHYGGLGGGHYTAHALNDDGVWCYYDDSRLTTDVEKGSIVSDAAYVLYYRRRDVPVDEDFLVKLQTPEPQGPAIISDIPDSKVASISSEVSGSNAAVVDDDNMDVEDTCSRTTSAMGSMDGVDDFENPAYQDTDNRILDEDDDHLARQ